jgi:cystathionine beta-lyase/cystathionine gamma-synthase
MDTNRKLATTAVHAGERLKHDDFSSTTTPIFSSTTFLYDSLERIDRIAGGEPGYMYGRYHNPTNAALEQCLAELEGADHAVTFGSGMAAIHAALLAAGLQAGDLVLCSQDVYGATSGLLNNVFAPLGVRVTFAPLITAADMREAFAGQRPRVVLVETVSNPLLRVADLPELARHCRESGARLIVDATFTTPLLSRPLELGADFVVHSATKYLAGHGDVLAGVVLVRDPDLPALLAVRKLVGGILGPFEAWLTLRGIKTLPLRVERQCRNAEQVAEWLSHQRAVERVNYPGLAAHPDHAVAHRQFGGLYGGVVSFEIRGADKEAMYRFADSLKLCLKGTSLGDVQTLLLHPVSSSHHDVAPKQRERIGIRDNLVRLSLGIEDVDDIIADLEQALDKAAHYAPVHAGQRA